MSQRVFQASRIGTGSSFYFTVPIVQNRKALDSKTDKLPLMCIFWIIMSFSNKSIITNRGLVIINDRTMIINRAFVNINQWTITKDRGFIIINRWTLLTNQRTLDINQRTITKDRGFIIINRWTLDINQRTIIINRSKLLINEAALIINRRFLIRNEPLLFRYHCQPRQNATGRWDVDYLTSPLLHHYVGLRNCYFKLLNHLDTFIRHLLVNNTPLL